MNNNLSKIASTIMLLVGTMAWAHATPLVDVDWVVNHLDNPEVVLVDLRKEEDYAVGHIPGSVNAPYGAFGWREEVDGVIGMLPPPENINQRIGSLGITPTNHVVVIPYGNNSSDVGAAARVYWTFKVLGHDKVSLLNGGQKSWSSQDLYTLQSTAVKSVDVGVYPGQVNQDLVIDTKRLLDLVNDGDVQPVDARIDEQWQGKAKHPKARIPGAIPTAKRLPQADLINADTGKFISPNQIIEVASANGWELDGSKPLISYCNTGHWAATAWFALSEVAAIPDVKLYDGSMVAWSQDEKNPLINSPNRIEQFISAIKN